MCSEKELPFQGHINLLQEFADFAKAKNIRELEHPSVLATIIFIRTTIREKEFGADEFAPHYEATKQVIQEHLGIEYLRSWIDKIETLEAKYAKKKPKPVDNAEQRKPSPDLRETLSAYFNDLWKRLNATSFDSVEKLELSNLNDDEFCLNVVGAVPFNWGKHKDENELIGLNNTIKNILKFIKKENPDLHARLEAKIKSKTSEAKRRMADANPSELDDWPEDKWFGLSNDGVPKANWPNVYFAVKRSKIIITYDEWADEHIIQYKDAPPRSVKFDEMLPFLFEQFFNAFKFVPKEEQVKIALKIISQKPKNRINSLIASYEQYEKYSSGNYDIDLKYLQDIGVKIWGCKDGPYEREVVRSIFIGHVQRAYYPGCFLQRLITLIGKGKSGKSTACQILAGNHQLIDGKYGEKNFTRVNIFTKTERDRYAALKGKTVHEYAERAKISSIDAAQMKNDITSTTEFVRHLFKDEGSYEPRWYDTICTVDKDEYGQDPEDRRDIGLRVGAVNLALFAQEYPKIMGAAVYLVKHGMSGVISDDVLDEAKRQHAVSIIKTDLMEILEPIFALTHLPNGIPTAARDRICERYQIAYHDDVVAKEDIVIAGEVFEKDQDVVKQRTYYVGGKGLERFVSDYRLFTNRLDIRMDMDARKTAILNLLIQVEGEDAEGHFRWQPLTKVTKVKICSGLWIAIRGFSLTLVAPWVGHVEKLAMEYIYREHDFIEHISKQRFVRYDAVSSIRS